MAATAGTSTGLLSGSIKWTGLASGTDFGSVVEQLVAIERRTITRQETWKAEWQQKITAISGLNTRLVSLKLDAQDKDIRSELLSRATSISDEKVVSVINTSTASLGSYDITVAESTREKFVSRSYEKGKTIEIPGGALGDTFSITVGDPANGGHTYTLAAAAYAAAPVADAFRTGAGSSLQSLADDINKTVEASGKNLVHATVELDKDNNGVLFERLYLTSTESGSAGRIKVEDAKTSLRLGETYIDDPVYNTFKGSDAKVSIVRDPLGEEYVGPVNKTFTFVATNSGELGQQEISFQWADTEGHSGKFTVKSVDEEVEIYQGLKIKFELGVSGRFVANESFTIDCQAPTLQKGQNSGVAQTEKVVHAGFIDQISPIHDGTAAEFVYKYKGVKHTVNVTDGMSLNILADAINSASDNPGVTASVINDGSGTATSCHLILTGNDTGAESTIEVVEGNFSKVDFGPGFFTTAREATNAMVKVDGFPAGDENWMQRRVNEVADAIEGVILTVKAPGTSTLTVVNDITAMRDKIMQLVESVNFCKTYILEYTKWGESNLQVGMDENGQVTTGRENPNGTMIGNYGFQIAQSNLDLLMNSALVPFSQDPSLTTKERLDKRQKYYDDHGLVYTSLADIGITSDPDNQGLYKVEQNRLLECINANPEAVIKLFTHTDEIPDKDSEGKDIMVSIRGVAIGIAERMTKITSDSDEYDTHGNFIRKAKGIMVTLQENYQSIIEGIDAKIAREERRVALVKQRLTDKFNRLEVALQQMEDQQAKLESSISSLSSNS
ncbi:MAG: flagellar filament capping protein FliD [Deltaproteobacteria bacterium]|jgi:flagellar hook-associated protein 2|nr:flagellar filament capping protein FliD [Deltaproteobacteria bacterium]